LPKWLIQSNQRTSWRLAIYATQFLWSHHIYTFGPQSKLNQGSFGSLIVYARPLLRPYQIYATLGLQSKLNQESFGSLAVYSTPLLVLNHIYAFGPQSKLYKTNFCVDIVFSYWLVLILIFDSPLFGSILPYACDMLWSKLYQKSLCCRPWQSRDWSIALQCTLIFEIFCWKIKEYFFS